jgi:Bacterial cell division membrane protein
MINNSKKNLIDYQLIFILISLAIISCISIAAADPIITSQSNNYEFFFKQIQWYSISFIFMFFIYFFGSERIYLFIWWIYGILIILLIGLAIHQQAIDYGLIASNQSFIPFASYVNGATRWYVLPGIGSFQPSEFTKIIIIITLTRIIKNHNNIYQKHTFSKDLLLVFKVLIVAIPPAILIFLQKESGITLIILISLIFLFFGSGIQMRWFIIGFTIIALAIGLLTYFYIFNHDIFASLIKGYRLGRFYGWLAPEATYSDYGYQLFNALLSFGSSGLFGHGFQSILMLFPEPQTDFIFAVILQNFGFIGGFITLVFTILINIKILMIGLKSRVEEHKYLAFGICGLLITQQFWNISMILGLLPISGIALPFISYGGSSLLSYMLVMGIFLDIERKNRIYRAKHAKYTL